MDNKTINAVFEDGEIIFPQPVDMEGCWRVQVTFLERQDAENMPIEANPHRPENLSFPDRLEEIHREVDSSRPHYGPI